MGFSIVATSGAIYSGQRDSGERTHTQPNNRHDAARYRVMISDVSGKQGRWQLASPGSLFRKEPLMSGRTPVLGDHRRVKSKLVTPFNDKLGPMREVSWINTMIPELLWIALLHDAYGDRRAVEIITAFTRAVREYSPEFNDTVWAAAGKFATMPNGALQQIVKGIDSECADALKAALTPLAACYPSNPLNAIYDGEPRTTEPAMVGHLRQVVSRLYDRSDRSTIMVQATAIWIAFDSGRLKVASHLSLASFPKIEDYPVTELSQRIAASIRASLNQMFGDEKMMASDGRWPIDFWNHGLQLQACESGDE